MKTLYKDRLTKLGDFLAYHVPDERFDLSGWRNNGQEGMDSDGYIDDETLRTGCGTTACAIGWACTISEFKAAGLSYTGFTVSYDDLVSWGAVEEFFGLSFMEAMYLFSDSSYKANASPYDVAARLYFAADSQEGA